ncbi:MAG: hypothetical protein E7498_02560 [Ruminococcus sp.]|nr:hypothetical protein [Ruminococcus sp.]
MYVNLCDHLKKKGLSVNAAAAAIGMPEATFRTKVQNRSFSVEEAFSIKENLFPELDIFYLFKRDEKGE